MGCACQMLAGYGVARYRRSYCAEDSGEGCRQGAQHKLFARGARMSNRDEFPPRIRRIVALRASHRCSFTACGQPTAGPSDESPEAVNMVGEAAHIHAA